MISLSAAIVNPEIIHIADEISYGGFHATNRERYAKIHFGGGVYIIEIDIRATTGQYTAYEKDCK